MAPAPITNIQAIGRDSRPDMVEGPISAATATRVARRPAMIRKNEYPRGADSPCVRGDEVGAKESGWERSAMTNNLHIGEPGIDIEGQQRTVRIRGTGWYVAERFGHLGVTGGLDAHVLRHRDRCLGET